LKVLVTGAAGMLGRQVVLAYKRRGAAVYGLSRRELDITKPDQINIIIQKIKPDVVLNYAAYTNVDGAEEEKEQAFLINGPRAALSSIGLPPACSSAGAYKH